MKCLETRQRNGMKWRRYRTADGRTITTYELPEAVLKGAAPAAKLKERLEMWQNGERLRARRHAVLARIEQGLKPLAIADELGLSTRQVQMLKRKRNA